MAPGKSRDGAEPFALPSWVKYRSYERGRYRLPAARASACPGIQLGTSHLFDGKREMAADGGKDHFGDLTDDLVWRVLSFLPGDDALQSCVLSPWWRDLWRRTTTIRFNLDDWSSFPIRERFDQLVMLILLLRGISPLAKCEISASPEEFIDDARSLSLYANMKLLIVYALHCQVKELLLGGSDMEHKPLILDMPFISEHLKMLHLERVTIRHSAPDFSGCPVLENLKLRTCRIYASKIASKSLKRLCITGLCIFRPDFHIQIFAPDLISLQLEDFHCLTPLLENMPFLETAHVELGLFCTDYCNKNQREGCDVQKCACHAYPVEEGVLLNGLSNAVNLELIAEPEVFIYRWDLARCPIFGKLKTLVLNEWFTTIDLLCILQHSPILEMLTLKLGNTENLLRATGAQETVRQSVVCAHLKVVNIECGRVDEEVRIFLNFLNTCGILHEQISIKLPG